jgi:hypothetical protein
VIDRLGIPRAMLTSSLLGALAGGALAGAGDVPGTRGATAQHAGGRHERISPQQRTTTARISLATPLSGLAGGLVCHFCLFVSVEVAIVAMLAASALALPLAGGRVEALTICAIGLGHIVGAFISLPLWAAAGERVRGYALLVCGCMLLSAALWWWTERGQPLKAPGGSVESVKHDDEGDGVSGGAAAAEAAAPAEAEDSTTR